MKTVLVVEEDDNQRLLYEWEFCDDGFRVVTAASLDEAMCKMTHKCPDCIVTCLCLRCQNPTAKLCRFLKNVQDIPVIVNTVFSDGGGQEVQARIDDYVIKSSDVEKLKQRVRVVLDRHNQPPLAY